MTIRDEEIRRMSWAISVRNPADVNPDSTAHAAYNAMETPKMLAALQEQTRWRRLGDEKPVADKPVLVKRFFDDKYDWPVARKFVVEEHEAGEPDISDTGSYSSKFRWYEDYESEGGVVCHARDLWQPITMPEGV